MDALIEAKRLIEMAESEHETSEAKGGNAFYRGLSEKHYAQAAVYAAVAQAEQLKRIADLMEAYAHVYLDPAITAHINDE